MPAYYFNVYLDSTKYWTISTMADFFPIIPESSWTPFVSQIFTSSVLRESFCLLAIAGCSSLEWLSFQFFVNTRDASSILCSFASHRTPFSLLISKRTRTAAVPFTSSKPRLISCEPLINPLSTSPASTSLVFCLLSRNLSPAGIEDGESPVALMDDLGNAMTLRLLNNLCVNFFYEGTIVFSLLIIQYYNENKYNENYCIHQISFFSIKHQAIIEYAH